ncbi:hypothetical protein LCGC14_0903050 [marine sediment metagenome]|uniref:TOG domain-containing protein n=1 Tax=marine sediment metagenome TaxID=412755 RepID=A0A0F9S2P8_9ZZZZ
MSAPLEKLLRDARIDLVLSRIEKDESVLKEVIKYIDSNIRSIKFNSILVLGEVGKKSANAVSKIVSCLEDEDWSICREAARSLGKIGDIAKEAVSYLSSLLENDEESIRKEAAIALGKIGNPTLESISSLIKALDDESEIVRTEVAIALGEIGSDAYEAIPFLMKSLKDLSWTVRTASAQSISLIGKESTKAIPSLISALEDPDWRVRYRVANALKEIGDVAVPGILEVLDHSNKIVRKEAIDTLGEMKIADPKIINAISKLLTDKAEMVRGKTADTLRNIGKAAVPNLLRGLEEANNKMKVIIISALGGIGSDAKDAIPTLISILEFIEEINSKEIETKKNLLYSKSILPRIKLMFSALNEYFSTPVKSEAVKALGRIGKDSENAISALEYALINPKFIIRREAALSLGKLGSSAVVALPSLIEALDDRNPDVRWRASEALGIIGVNTENVISGLSGLVHDKCDYVCEAALTALDDLAED